MMLSGGVSVTQRPMPPAVVDALLEELESSGNVAALAKQLGLDPARVRDRLKRRIEGASAPPVVGESLHKAFLPAKPTTPSGRSLSDGQARALAAIAFLDKGSGVASRDVATMMEKAGHRLDVPSKFVASRIQGYFSGLENRGFIKWPAKEGFHRKAFITDTGHSYLESYHQDLHVRYAAVKAGMENDDGGASKFF